MRILISAYGCEPDVGSEPGAGWAWAAAAAEHHDVWLLTRANNQPSIQQAIELKPSPRLTICPLDLPSPYPRWKKRVPGGAHVYYCAWQALARREARSLHESVNFDLVHHLTWSTDWLPVGARLKGVPLVWGPIGGATRTPWRHWRWFGMRGMLIECLRAVTIPAVRRIAARPTARAAAVVLAQNRDEARVIPRGVQTRVEPNVAIELTVESRSIANAPDGHHCVFAGRLLYWKGLRLAVAALAQDAAAEWTMSVYGDGPDRRAAERLARRLDVIDRLTFHGRRPREEVLEAIAAADAFLLPSFHDAAGWAVAEATSIGCPVVVLGHGGPAEIVDAAGGVAVPIDEPDLPRALANALASCAGRRLTPSTRWSPKRLPSLLDDVYRQAAGVCESGPNHSASGAAT